MAYGEAYAFFRYDGPRENITKELPIARKLAQTPSGLELKLLETAWVAPTDDQLVDVLEGARVDRLNYTLHALQEKTENEVVAGRLGNIVNALYASPLYKRHEEFHGEILFKEHGEYVLFQNDES